MQVNMKRKEEEQGLEPVAVSFIPGPLPLATPSLSFVPFEHICGTTEGNVKCSGHPVFTKLQVKSKRVGWAQEGSLMRYPCRWKHDMEQGRRGTQALALQVACVQMCDVVGRAVEAHIVCRCAVRACERGRRVCVCVWGVGCWLCGGGGGG